MAETVCVLTRSDSESFLKTYAETTRLALDVFQEAPEYQRIFSQDVPKLFAQKSFQLFLKDQSFCNDDFNIMEIYNKHIGKTYSISRLSGQGQIQIFVRSLSNDKWEVSVGYPKAFERNDGMFILPSPSLKSFYKTMSRDLRRLSG